MTITTRLNKFLLLTSLVAFICACTTNPYTGERQTSNAIKFGAAGAIICGLIGSRNSSQHARNAALGCGAIGAGIGAYMDVQEVELREQLAGSGVQIQRNGDQLNLIMPGNITFNTNEYSVRPQFMPILDSIAKILYKYKDTRLLVTGHTDSTGSNDYNYNLSNRRARGVANYLSAQGVNQNRLISQGLGPDQPIADNTTPSGRSSNRRVELQIVAIQN